MRRLGFMQRDEMRTRKKRRQEQERERDICKETKKKNRVNNENRDEYKQHSDLFVYKRVETRTKRETRERKNRKR